MIKNKLKIGYFADGPWSHLAFEKIIEDNTIEVKFICPRNDTKDLTLKDYATQYKIDYLHPIKINTNESIELIKSYGCDILVSMSFNQIFKQDILNVPPLGIINCHAGKLPFYRGRNILNWALINDEDEFGITVHYVDDGIDTGDIILQRTFPITDEDNYETLLKRSYNECAKILYDAIKNIQNGKGERIRQEIIHPNGFYCGKRGIGDEIIDWNQSSRSLFNFIRAICIPGPRAITHLNEIPVYINKSHLYDKVPKYIGKPGQILSKTNEGFLVKTKDTYLEILEVETDTKLKVGDVFK